MLATNRKGKIMALSITITKSSGVEMTPVPEDVAKDLQDAYEALKDLPNNRVGIVDFNDHVPASDSEEDKAAALALNIKAARLFVRQATAWAASQEPPLTFSRRGEIKANPTQVKFRIYLPNPEDGRGNPGTQAQERDTPQENA